MEDSGMARVPDGAEAGERREQQGCSRGQAQGLRAAALPATLPAWRSWHAGACPPFRAGQLSLFGEGLRLVKMIFAFPGRIGEFFRDHNATALSASAAGARQRDVLPLFVAFPAQAVFRGERMLREGASAVHTDIVELWTYLSAMAVNYLYCGHFPRDQWHGCPQLHAGQRAALTQIRESVEWFVAGYPEDVAAPDWDVQLLRQKASYDLHEDSAALPVKLEEIAAGLPEAKHVATRDVLDFCDDEMRAGLAV